MTPYEHGFLTKCAECKVPEYLAVHLLKLAQEFPELLDPVPDGQTVYEMQPGDTVSQVIQNHGISQRYLPDVLKANDLTEETARKIRPGRKIYFEEDPAMYDAFRKAKAERPSTGSVLSPTSFADDTTTSTNGPVAVAAPAITNRTVSARGH